MRRGVNVVVVVMAEQRHAISIAVACPRDARESAVCGGGGGAAAGTAVHTHKHTHTAGYLVGWLALTSRRFVYICSRISSI